MILLLFTTYVVIYNYRIIYPWVLSKNTHKPSSLNSPPEVANPEKELLKYAQNYSWDEPLFKTLVEIAPIGITLSSSQRKLDYSNQAFANIVGYTQEELYGMDWGQLTYEADRDSNIETYKRLVRGEIDFFEFEKRYWHKAGHMVWCKVKVTRVEDKQTGQQLSLALIQDIHEEKRLSESVVQQEHIIRMGEEVAAMGTFVWNIETNETEASPGVLRIFELDPETTTSHNLFERAMTLIHPEDVAKVFQDVTRSAQEKIPIVTIYRIQFPDGRIKWLKTMPGPFVDAKRMLRTVQDITEDVRKNSLLDRQKAMNQLGEEVAGFGTFIWDIETKELEVSRGFYRLFGVQAPEEDRIESFDTFLEYIHPDDLPMIVEGYQTIAETRESDPREFRIITQDGELKWVVPSAGKWISPTVRLNTLQDITEEKLRSTQLMRQNSMLEMGVQGAKLASFVWNAEELTILANHGVRELYEIEPETFSPKGLFDKIVSLTHPDDLETFQTNLKKIIVGEPGIQFDVRIVTESEVSKWIRIFPCKSLSGKEKLATVQDVTEDVFKSELLRQQKELIQVGEEAAGLGTFIWDVESNDILGSEGYYQVYELDSAQYPSHTIYQKIFSMVHPDDMEKLLENRKVVVDHKQPSPVEFRILLDSGKVKWLRTSEGKFISHTQKLGTVQDITEEKKKNLKLEQQEEMVRLGGEIGNIGVDILNLETGAFLYSPNLLKMFHLDPEEVNEKNLFKKIHERFHPEDLDKIHEFTKALSSNPSGRGALIHRIQLPNGEIRWMQVVSEKFKDTTSRITINKDITEYIQQSEELRESQKEIEQLLYTVSHDLRAPLRHVSGYAQMLQLSSAQKLDERETNNLNNVLSASNRLGIMIDELLQFFRSRQIEIKEEPIDLGLVTQNMQALFSSDTEQRGIEWSIGALPIVKGDQIMLEKVMMNLLSNAVKFTSKTEQARIDISAKEQEGMALIAVEDNGAGFKMKYMDKLFAVFQRLHKRREFDGTGIGLANVKRIIEKHGGSIWAEAEVGKGAKFYFTLPLYKP